MSYPEDLRQRIMVVAIAPGCYIPKKLCKDVVHYRTAGDLVTMLDPFGYNSCKENVITLRSKTKSGFMDHGYQSPTYEDVLRDHLTNYVREHGH